MECIKFENISFNKAWILKQKTEAGFVKACVQLSEAKAKELWGLVNPVKESSKKESDK